MLETSIIFLQIPQTGGTTLHRIIEQQYEPSAVFTLTPREDFKKIMYRFKRLSEEKRMNLKILKGHLLFRKRLDKYIAAFFLEPEEFKSMVNAIREVEKALGKVIYALTEKTKKSREFSRSLFVVKDVNAGEALTEENNRSIRPGYGLSPVFLKDVLGKKAKTNIKKNPTLMGLN